MKTKSILLTGILFFAAFFSNAQNDDEKCFNENSHIINIGVGIGSRYYNYSLLGSYIYQSTPAFSISYEQAFKKKLGPGYLGVGGYIGYQNTYYRYDDIYYLGSRYYYSHSWNYMMFAARAAYHLDFINWKKGEVYAGVVAGLRVQTYSFYTNSPDPDAQNYKLSSSSVWPAYTVFAGARWCPSKNFGLFAEVGYGISYLTGGVSIKF